MVSKKNNAFLLKKTPAPHSGAFLFSRLLQYEISIFCLTKRKPIWYLYIENDLKAAIDSPKELQKNDQKQRIEL